MCQAVVRRVTAQRAELEAARGDEDAARTELEHLQTMRGNPLSHMAKAHVAQGEHHVADAAVQVALAELRDVLAGPTVEEIATAEADPSLAEAQLHLAETQRDRLTLRSPVAGNVTARVASVGETVLPGATLLTVADLTEVFLTVYLPQTSLGQVFLGQTLGVTVDSFPERRFEGYVVHIADEPQYTPRNVATKEERVNTVYEVKIRIPNPKGLLKPGMAADAVSGRRRAAPCAGLVSGPSR